MSLITRCPACSTMYRVVPDQLRVSEGWVRCGQCDEVFDANAHLQSEPLEQEAASEPMDDAGAPLDDVRGEAERDPVAPDQAREPFLEDQAPTPAYAAEPSFEVAPQEEEDAAAGEPQAQADAEAGTEAEAEGDVEAAAQAELAPDALQEPRLDQEPLSLRYVPPDARSLSFMRVAPTPSPWHRTGVRVALALLSVVLMLLLALQVLMQERDAIVAVAPQSKAMLEALCEPLGCRVAPLRQMEAVVIESSSFAKVHADVYRLNVTLKNSAQLPIAIPDLELTLTDIQDQPVLRRVFAAAELQTKSDAMAANSELNASLAVSVKLPGATEKISGYRLLAFYP